MVEDQTWRRRSSSADENDEERQGGDITAADMVPPPEEPSRILEFYADASVLLTGGSGFLGKIFLDKLLRTCQQIRCVYLLMRPKKGKDIEKRLEEIFDGPNFDPLRRKCPAFLDKIRLVSGDCSLPDLGLNEADKARLIQEVDCIFHCAATVRFDEKIRIATNINVRSVRDLLRMAKQMKKLRAMIYVSTAFSNCTQRHIDEAFYAPPLEGAKLLALTDLLDDSKLDAITPAILGDFPNTYVFTKAIAEDVVRSEGRSLPVGVFRPSIVIGSVREPVVGWIDNLYGATGVLVGAALGLLRTLHGRQENLAEMVPADYVINSAMAAAWDIATMKTLNDNREAALDQSSREEKFEREIPVYNFVSSAESPITWEGVMLLTEKYAKQVPSPLVVWHYFFAIRPNWLSHKLAVIFYHTIPAYIVDFLAVCIGKKPMLVKGYQKIDKFGAVISYFITNQWAFQNNNTRALWRRMNTQDRRLFEFSMSNFLWDPYFHTYIRGIRVYLLKDPMETIPQGTVKYYKVMVAHYVLIAVLFYVLYEFLFMLWRNVT